MKKKLLSLALTLALCLGLTVPAFAETWTETIDGITITAYPSGSISYTGTGKLTAEHAERGAVAVWSMTKVDDTFMFSISVGQGVTITDEFKDMWMAMGWSVSYNNSVDRTVGGFTDVEVDDYFADPVLWAVNKKITAGTSETTFSPNQNCTVAQILTFLWRAYGSTTYSGKNPFSDVKTSDYYYNAARWAYDKGMVTGSTFGGDRPCTRSMAVTYMWKAAGGAWSASGEFIVDKGTMTRYSGKGGDVVIPDGVVYIDWDVFENNKKLTSVFIPASVAAIDLAGCNNLTDVYYEGSEAQWKEVSYEAPPQAAVHCNSKKPSVNTGFTDVPSSADYAEAVAWAVDKGVTSGTTATTFSPDSVCTRGQIVTFLHRALAK